MTSPMPRSRILPTLLQDICQQRGIELTSFSSDWVFCLQRDSKTAYVLGYDFGLNTATSQLIAKDKVATADLLTFHGVPCVEHRLVNSPLLAEFVPVGGNWPLLLAYFEEHNRDLVCKPNDGTGGSDVFRARSPVQLEAAIHRLLQRSRSCCVSPFVAIANEFRAILVKGESMIVYSKDRPTLRGDGVRTVRDLLVERLLTGASATVEAALLQGDRDAHLDLDAVLADGEVLPLDWRHNLGKGALPEVEGEASRRREEITDLARRAASAIGITAASVDIVAVEGRLLVLEINSGIMMESFARSSENHRKTARQVYERIVTLMFETR
ncbi:MAG: RimK-like protein [Thermoanaerobaculia bacterium]